MKNGVEKISPDAMDRLDRLERRRKDLAQEVEDKEQNNLLTDEEKEKLNSEMKKLLRDTEKLLNEISEELHFICSSFGDVRKSVSRRVRRVLIINGSVINQNSIDFIHKQLFKKLIA